MVSQFDNYKDLCNKFHDLAKTSSHFLLLDKTTQHTLKEVVTTFHGAAVGESLISYTCPHAFFANTKQFCCDLETAIEPCNACWNQPYTGQPRI